MIEAVSCGGVVIFRGKILLLYKNYRNRYEGWVLPKGTVEEGEEHSETALREVMEETGLKVKNIQYFGSQPWGIVGNLQIGYVCDVDGPDEIHVDGNEVKEAVWFERSEIPPRDTTSITGAMIEAFRKGEI